MPEESNSFPDVNRIIHEPARLAILTVLSTCGSADFTFLQNATGVTKGNLSVQISRLEKARLVDVEKSIKGKKMRTAISLSRRGKNAIAEYWRTMDKIRRQAIPAT